MTTISQQQVRGFFENLQMAVYDKLLEREGYRIVIYVDADVAVRMVAGFEERGGSEKENLARALINSGFCERVEMVRPHAFEFASVSSWAKEGAKSRRQTLLGACRPVPILTAGSKTTSRSFWTAHVITIRMIRGLEPRIWSSFESRACVRSLRSRMPLAHGRDGCDGSIASFLCWTNLGQRCDSFWPRTRVLSMTRWRP